VAKYKSYQKGNRLKRHWIPVIIIVLCFLALLMIIAKVGDPFPFSESQQNALFQISKWLFIIVFALAIFIWLCHYVIRLYNWFKNFYERIKDIKDNLCDFFRRVFGRN